MEGKMFNLIEVKIPYEPNKRLGHAIDTAMGQSDDWVLILDHDVFIGLNPYWYDICLDAINKVGHKAGWITCLTNQIGCPLQKLEYRSNNINDHFELAESIYKKNKGKILDITERAKKWKLSGFFILTHVEAYNDIKNKFGIPGDKFIGWDNYYNDRLIEAGYTLHLMQDLYVFHGYRRLWKKEKWGLA